MRLAVIAFAKPITYRKERLSLQKEKTSIFTSFKQGTLLSFIGVYSPLVENNNLCHQKNTGISKKLKNFIFTDSMSAPISLLDAWNLYEQWIRGSHESDHAYVMLSHAKTALIRYTLPGFGHLAPETSHLTKHETEIAFEYMQSIPLVQFQNAIDVQQTVF